MFAVAWKSHNAQRFPEDVPVLEAIPVSKRGEKGALFVLFLHSLAEELWGSYSKTQHFRLVILLSM